MIPVQEILDQLSESLGSFISTEVHTDKYRYINSAMRLAASKRDWSHLKQVTNITTSIIDEIVAIDETNKAYNVIRGTNEDMYIATLDEYYTSDDTAMVGIWDTTFIARSPGTYKVIHSVYPERVSTTQTNINFPDSFKDLIFEYALSFGYASIGNDESRIMHEKMGDKMLPAIAARRNNPTPKQIIRMGQSHSF